MPGEGRLKETVQRLQKSVNRAGANPFRLMGEVFDMGCRAPCDDNGRRQAWAVTGSIAPVHQAGQPAALSPAGPRPAESPRAAAGSGPGGPGSREGGCPFTRGSSRREQHPLGGRSCAGSLKILLGSLTVPQGGLRGLLLSHGQGWALGAGGAAGPRAFVWPFDLGAAGPHPAGVFGTQEFSKPVFALGLPARVRPEEQ